MDVTMRRRAQWARQVAVIAALGAGMVGCRKQYINMHNGAPQHEVRIVHNCSGAVANVYFDREYGMRGHITGTSHSVMRGYPLKMRLAAGRHTMVVVDGSRLYTSEFRVTGPLQIESDCGRSR
jgi:hypothetical protein